MNMTLGSVLRAPLSALALASVLLAGCGGGGDTPAPPVAANRAPAGSLTLSGMLVSAGGNGDAATSTGSDVKFDASGSSDPDGDTLSYSWNLVSKPAGSAVAVQGSSNQLVIKPDAAGTYVVSVRISDGKGASVDKQASIVVTANTAPVGSMVVRASYAATPSVAASTIVTVGATLLLDGSRSHDADGDPVTTTWEVLERPSGSRAALVSEADLWRLSTDVAGTYKVRARATDPLGAYSETVFPFEAVGTTPTVVGVASVNYSPIDAGGATINGTTGYKISLSDAGSNPDGVALTRTWTLVSKPAGSSSALDVTTGAFSGLTPDVLGDYVVRLVVTAPSGAASSYTTTVSVKNRRPLAAIATNATPVALPSGPTLRLPANSVVTLRGGNSSDADGDALTYSWSLPTKPAGSNASLSSTNQSTTQLITDLSGSYTVLLRVTDPSGAYSEQPIIIASGNAAPVAVVEQGRMTVVAGNAAKANAGLSFDDDEEALSYSWALDVKPAGSSATVGATTPQLSFTPDVAGTYVASVTVSDGKASSTAYVTIKATPVITTVATPLSFWPIMSKYSRGLDRLVTVSTAPDMLNIVDPFAGTIRQVPLPAAVRTFSISPDGKLAAVLHAGQLSLVDLASATLVRTSPTNGNQTEALITNAALVYLTGRYIYPADSTLSVLNARTGEDVSATYNTVFPGSYNSGDMVGVYSSLKRKIFFRSTGWDHLSVSLDASGAVTSATRIPASSSVPGTPMFLSANEELIITGAGRYFSTDTLSLVGSLNINSISSLSHSATADELIAVRSERGYETVNGSYRSFDAYEPRYYRFTGYPFVAQSNTVMPVVGGLQSYGIAIFHAGNNDHVAVVQTGGDKSTSAGVKYYVVAMH